MEDSMHVVCKDGKINNSKVIIATGAKTGKFFYVRS